MGATATSAPTRDEIIDDAIAIVRAQGAVHDPGNFWEIDDPDSYDGLADLWMDHERADPPPTECRVCIAGATYLALARRGVRDYDDRAYEMGLGYTDLRNKLVNELGHPNILAIEDNPDLIVEVLEAMR